ncbi:MAG TPA: topoisomerase DNA-binding C4 zinc finger domain-containing protein [Candidatus Gemmiger avicola]|uniref:Topoisomerase DNA-binding C4 zinc finger domain-containing protein n=1 Tax=Candidatus Gemmiger avicola TaxID=2838605 RepID=A0A9D2M6L1_9FIRM|nr:topoisomerase DNA-binding C4 zinc finger domain-containing protein [Candidatus Gemmiger avicola]
MLQNKVHLKWLSQYLGQAPDTFFSYIVFSNRCTLKKVTLTNGQHHVVNRNALLAAVKSNVRKTGHLLTADEIDQLYTKLEPLTQVSEVQKLAHIQAIQAKQPAAKAKTCKKPAVAGSEAVHPQPVPQGAADTPPVCPRCGGILILRTATKGKKAGTRFWGCTNYPKCRYTQPSSS